MRKINPDDYQRLLEKRQNAPKHKIGVLVQSVKTTTIFAVELIEETSENFYTHKTLLEFEDEREAEEFKEKVLALKPTGWYNSPSSVYVVQRELKKRDKHV